MSHPIGHLRVFGPKGCDVFVFDDCLVRAWTGLGSALKVAGDNMSGVVGVPGAGLLRGAADLGSRLGPSSQRFLTMTAEQIVADDKNNKLVRFADVTSASLKKGRWTNRTRRYLLLTTPDAVRKYAWIGDGAPRAMNADAYVVPLLQHVLGGRLEVEYVPR